MAQYRTGKVYVTNASQLIFGNVDTDWTSVAVGHWFSVQGSGITYTVGSVTQQALGYFSAYAGGTTYGKCARVSYGGKVYGSLLVSNLGHQPDISPVYWEELSRWEAQLTAPWAGSTTASATYGIVRDFTSIYNLPIPAAGDVEIAALLARGMNLIDSILGGGGVAADTRRSVAVVNDAATGDAYGMEQVSAAQSGDAKALRLFTSALNSSYLAFGKYTSSTVFSEYGRFDVSGVLNLKTNTLKLGSAFVTTLTNAATAARVLTFPDATGTLLYGGGPLGTPTSGVATNLTGTASGLTAGHVTTNANLTGGVTSVGNVATVVTNANLTGDVTSVGNATTLAAVNSNVGSFGGASSVPIFTVNAKGLITAASSITVAAAAGSLSGATLAAGVTASSLTSLGTITSLVATAASITTLTLLNALSPAYGGTGATSANAGLNALLPTQTGNAGKVLSTNGTNTSWLSVGGTGTVTSFAFTNANGVSGSISSPTSAPNLTITLGAITPSSVVSSGDITLSSTTGNLYFTGASYGKVHSTVNDLYLIAVAAGKKVYTQIVGGIITTVSASGLAVTGVVAVTGTLTTSGFAAVGSATVDSVNPLWVKKGSAGAAPTWLTPDVILAENVAGAGTLLQLYSDTLSGLGFSKPGTRNRGSIYYTHGTDTLTFSVAGATSAVLDTTGLTVSGAVVGSSTGFFAGQFAIGSGFTTGASVTLNRAQTGSVSTYGFITTQTVQSDSTTSASSFWSQPSTAVGSYTLGLVRHFVATVGSLGAGSAITTEAGFWAGAALTRATYNYGFYGDIASGTNRYNLYMSGTAANYLNGKTGIGTLPNGTDALAIGGSLSATGAISTSATDGVWAAPGGGTARKFGYLSNGGVTAYWGIEGSAGGSILGGTTAYAMVLGTATNKPLEFGVNNTKYMSLTTSGLAVTGALSASGNIQVGVNLGFNGGVNEAIAYSASAIKTYIGGNPITAVSSTGLAVTGTLSATGDVTLSGAAGTGGNGYITGPSAAGKLLTLNAGNTTGGINFRNSLGTEVASYYQASDLWTFSKPVAVTGTLSATGAITSTAATNQFLANGSSQGQITFQKGALQSVSIGSDLAGEMFFYGATEYGRWKSTGLAVTGNLSVSGTITGTFSGNATNITAYTINQNVGTANSPTFAGLTINGAITATGNITAYYSDDRLKTRLGRLENPLAKVCSLDGFFYKANSIAQALGYQAIREYGLSAQQVSVILPEIVAAAPIDSSYLTLRYERMAPLFVEAFKEVKFYMDARDAKIAELEERIVQLESAIKKN